MTPTPREQPEFDETASGAGGGGEGAEAVFGPVRPADPAIAGAQDRFISTWGQMGSAWGISRTMAEVHALLYITGQAMCTDDVMERLSISRGNASMSLRALEDWGIVQRVHRRGDRKEYFQAESDVWTMFRTIARERKKRELDPLVQALFDIRDMTTPERRRRERELGGDRGGESGGEGSGGDDRELLQAHHQRLDSMLEFIERVDMLSKQVLGPGGTGLQKLLGLLGRR
ncbi:MAG: GbsR/MarR family transcriptional regulator [Phycisphaerales bacterium]